jgi:DNA-binding response OmpR family regulator
MAAPAERAPEGVVLVVDDEEMVRQMAARILHDAGFRVLEAHDGEEAVTLLSTLGPTGVWLVVSDMAMPGITGTELAEIMTERWPEVPILLISGRCAPHAEYRGRFLSKPFLPETLIAEVKALLPSRAVAVGGQESAPVPVQVSAHWWHPRLPIA